MISSCYVHIPFCPSLCRCCAFERTLNLKHIPLWLERIVDEAARTLASCRKADPDFQLQTLYFGGGTPSVLDVDSIEKLMAVFRPYLAEDCEWTLEANPESISLEKLAAWKAGGVSRLSIGIQSFDPERLEWLGRRHTPQQAIEAIAKARQAGFTRISADLMFGFSGQSLDDLQRDLDAFLVLDLDHLSIYSLILEENSVMGVLGESGCDEELCAAMYERIVQVLGASGYEHYEISSFARNGEISRHNMAIWQDGLYLGIGAGACGRDEYGLYHHAGCLHDYLEHGARIEYDEDASPWFDAIMTGLRTRAGLDVEAWQRRYQMDFLKKYEAVLKKYQDMLCLKQGRLFCSERGMEILDSILVEFLAKD